VALGNPTPRSRTAPRDTSRQLSPMSRPSPGPVILADGQAPTFSLWKPSRGTPATEPASAGLLSPSVSTSASDAASAALDQLTRPAPPAGPRPATALRVARTSPGRSPTEPVRQAHAYYYSPVTKPVSAKLEVRDSGVAVSDAWVQAHSTPTTTSPGEHHSSTPPSPVARVDPGPLRSLGLSIGSLVSGPGIPLPPPPPESADPTHLVGWEKSIAYLQSTFGELEAAADRLLGIPDAGSSTLMTMSDKDDGEKAEAVPLPRSPPRPPGRVTPGVGDTWQGTRTPSMGSVPSLKLVRSRPLVELLPPVVPASSEPVLCVDTMAAVRALRVLRAVARNPRAFGGRSIDAEGPPPHQGEVLDGLLPESSPLNDLVGAVAAPPPPPPPPASMSMHMLSDEAFLALAHGRPVPSNETMLPLPPPTTLSLDPELGSVSQDVVYRAAGLLYQESERYGGLLEAAEHSGRPRKLGPGFDEFAELDSLLPTHSASRLNLAEFAQTEDLVTRAAASLEAESVRLQTLVGTSSGMERSNAMVQLGQCQVDLDRLTYEWRKHREHILVESAIQGGLNVARVLLASSRTGVVALRQDLAVCKKQLLTGMSEAAAVEFDVVGKSGGRLGDLASSDRGRIISDMPPRTAQQYADQAIAMAIEMRRHGAADDAVGASHARQSFAHMHSALEEYSSVAASEGVDRLEREMRAWSMHVDSLAPALASRRQEADKLLSKKDALEQELVKMRGAVDSLRHSQHQKLAALAKSISIMEGVKTAAEGDDLVEMFCHPLDESPQAVLQRRMQLEEAVEEEERQAAEERGRAAIEQLEARLAEEVVADERAVNSEEAQLRSGSWLRNDRSLTERRLDAVTNATKACSAEAERLSNEIRETEKRVARSMKLARDAQRLRDLRHDTHQLFATRRTPSHVVAQFLREALADAPFSEILLESLRYAHKDVVARVRASRDARAIQTLEQLEQERRQQVRSGASDAAQRVLVQAAVQESIVDRLERALQSGNAGESDAPSVASDLLTKLRTTLSSSASSTGSSKHSSKRASPEPRTVQARAKQWIRRDAQPGEAALSPPMVPSPEFEHRFARFSMMPKSPPLQGSPDAPELVSSNFALAGREMEAADAAIDDIVARVKRRLEA
jgi:hypothetical protein